MNSDIFINPYEEVENRMLLADITRTIKGHVKSNCEWFSGQELNDIYTSVLLTLINKLSLTQADRNRIKSENKGKNGSKRMETKLIELINDNNWKDAVVIGDNHRGYIHAVTAHVCEKIMEDLNYTTNYHITEEDLAIALIEGGLVIDGKSNREDKDAVKC